MRSLTVLQINDLHGYLAPHPEIFDLSADSELRMGGGLARIAALFREIRRETAGAVLALDNGDTFHGTMPAVQTAGEALVPPLAALALDAMTAHWEFAYGIDRLLGIGRRLPYPVLAANCRDAVGALPFPPFMVVERAGVRVGVVGLAAVVAAHLLPPADRDRFEFTLGERELRAHIPRLRREHAVDLVVVLSHLGFPHDCKLAAAVPGIDVLLSGHTHNRLRKPAVVDGTLIVQSGAHGSFVGRLDLEIGPAGLCGWRHALIPVDETIAADDAVHALVEAALGPFAAARANVVGSTRTLLHRYAMFESTMDNLLLDAVSAAAGTPIALANGWRYGAPIAAGPVTECDLWSIAPANPPVSLVELTGEALRQLMEENLENTFACDPWRQRGGYVKRCRGLRFVVKLENPAGHRIQEFRVDGDRLRDEATYSVAFLGEQAVPAGAGQGRRRTGVTAVEALCGYLRRGDSVEASLRGTVTVA